MGSSHFLPAFPINPSSYPVLTKQYAEQIARDWNTKDERSGFAGYVLEFEVETEYLRRFDIRKAGSNQHLEYWIPADELEGFNRHINGEIRVVAKFLPRSTR